jgi:hypothetical protein
MQMKEKISLTKLTEDESWVHHYQPESKRASMQWKHPSSITKFKVMPSAGKVMLIVFFFLLFSGNTDSSLSEVW